VHLEDLDLLIQVGGYLVSKCAEDKMAHDTPLFLVFYHQPENITL
jgi:hypothetical protein